MDAERKEAIVKAVDDLQTAIEYLGEKWKALKNLDGAHLDQKVHCATLAAECLKANGLHAVLDVGSFGAGVADIVTVVRNAL